MTLPKQIRREALALAATKGKSEPLVFEGEAAEALAELLENPPPLTPRMEKALAQVEAMARSRASAGEGSE